jgi:23S rRNA (cytosine1962-C5)-methyltransferase
MSYALLDSGDGRKLERFGEYVLIRPAAQAVWKPSLSKQQWDLADAIFTREKENNWEYRREIPSSWMIRVEGIVFMIALTDFGHLGIFPEHLSQCSWMAHLIQKSKKNLNVLNLFAYSGAATLAAAKAGAKVCHLDASKGMVAWARENAVLNKLEKAPIRWIIDDVYKFLRREVSRGVRYDGIICDPPTFGRGSQGQVFKLERDFSSLLELCKEVLVSDPSFFILSCHTPGMTPIVLGRMLRQVLSPLEGKFEENEMVLTSEGGQLLPYGSVARWSI